MFFRSWMVVVGVAVALGILSAASSVTDESQVGAQAPHLLTTRLVLSMLTNSPTVWGTLAVWAGWVARGTMRGAFAGFAALVVGLVCHCGFGMLVGLYPEHSMISEGLWSGQALPIGAILGMVGAMARRPGPTGLAMRFLVPLSMIAEPVLLNYFTVPLTSPWPERVASVVAGAIILCAGVLIAARIAQRWTDNRHRSHYGVRMSPADAVVAES